MSHSKPGIIRRTFRAIFGTITWIRTALFNLLFIGFILLILASLAPEEQLVIPESTALRIAPSGFLVDQYSYQPPMEAILGSPVANETLTHEIIEAISRATADNRITALVIDPSNMSGGGISKLQEIGRAIDAFKNTGRPVYALASAYTQQQYYLASYADEVLMHPMGGVLISGYGSYRNYFKETLEKLSVNFHVF